MRAGFRLLVPGFALLTLGLTALACGGAAQLDCSSIGEREEEILLAGYALNQLNRSVDKSEECLGRYIHSPDELEHACWSHLIGFGEWSADGIGFISAVELNHLDAGHVAEHRAVYARFREADADIVQFFTSISVAASSESPRFLHDKPRTNQAITLLERVEQLAERLKRLNEEQRRMTGMELGGRFGYCDGEFPEELHLRILQNSRSPSLPILEALPGE